MGLFDLFSNDKAEEAARQRNQGLEQGYDALSSAYGQGRDAINSTSGQGRDALTAGYGKAGDLYSGLIASYGGGAGAYGDATGANGAAGTARARANFQADPGYNFQMDQGLQALQRTHAAAGNLSSGNADTDTLKYSQGLADQSYGNYVSRLAPYLGAQAGAVGGAANVAAGLGQGLNANYTGQGGALNQSYQGQGGAANAKYTGQGASDAAATMNNYNISGNMWNGIGKAVDKAAGLFGAFA